MSGAFNIPGGLTFDYRFTAGEGRNERHDWSLVGDRGGINIWAQPAGDYAVYGEHWYGGVEVHHAAQPSYLSDAAKHDLCWLLLKPCWHDGSSLYFSENINPLLPEPTGGPVNVRTVHSLVLHHLRDWFESHLAEEVAA